MIDFNKKYIRKAIVILPSIPLLSLGIALCLYADLGADIYTSFQQGIAIKIGTNVGNVNLAFSIIILIIFMFIDKSLINIGSILMAVGIGPLMTFFDRILKITIAGQLSIATKISMVIVGTFFIAMALSWYIPINLGVQPIDMIIITISKIINKTYGIGMYVFNILMLIGTVILGGTLGLGTIINLLLTGKLVDFITPSMKIFVLKLIDERNAH